MKARLFFLLTLLSLCPGCANGIFDSGQSDIAMAQNLLYEKQQLDRERLTIAAEDAQLSTEVTAFIEGPEREFLSTLTAEQIVLYKKNCSAYVQATTDEEMHLAVKEVFQAFPKEKAFRFIEISNAIWGFGDRLNVLEEKIESYNQKNLDFQKRHAAMGQYLMARRQQLQQSEWSLNLMKQQDAQRRLEQQQREQELYRLNMMNSLSSIQSDLSDIAQQHRKQQWNR